MDFVLFIITISEFINIVKGVGCKSSYYHCTGYNWCCPYGYSCTGTSICNKNPYSSYSSSYSSSISYSRIGYIVGGCIGGLVILACIIVAVCKSSSKPGRVIAPPAGRRTTLIAATTAQPTNGMHPMFGQQSSVPSSQNIANPPPSYNHM
ncbi:uncharacterized protein LOC127737307 isoform X1 [Mytilus californianus]|uniref:uncharacterized protein LOC127737307 isoform X1 n=1 Tax=Mytilus californianus TaxID=6549 RepID=UPI002246A89E|nr:uncharacterized protein LOC127737307 isoform X1 [Mytilus californianus]